MSDIYSLSGLAQPGQRLQQGEYDELFIEEFGGLVEGTIGKTSIFESFIPWRPIRGTNTLKNYRNGDTVLQTLTPGSNPQPTPVDFDDVSVTVDTVMLARNSVFTLDDLQNSYDAKVQLAQEQGKVISRFIDSVGFIKGIHAAHIVAGDGTGGTTRLPSGWEGGSVIDLDNPLDEEDPELLEAAIAEAVTQIEEKDIDPSEEGFQIYLRPRQRLALINSNKLINTDYSSGNGNFARREILKSNGLPIISTNRLPKAAVPNHPLSNARNNGAYNLTEAQARTVVLITSPRAYLAGSTIPLTSDIFWNKETKSHFIDSWLALGAAANNPAFSAVVRKVT